MNETQLQQAYIDEEYDRQRDFELDAKADAEDFRAVWFNENKADLKAQFMKDNDLTNAQIGDETIDVCEETYTKEFMAYCDDEFVDYCEHLKQKHT
jgi:hypothetical protein